MCIAKICAFLTFQADIPACLCSSTNWILQLIILYSTHMHSAFQTMSHKPSHMRANWNSIKFSTIKANKNSNRIVPKTYFLVFFPSDIFICLCADRVKRCALFFGKTKTQFDWSTLPIALPFGEKESAAREKRVNPPNMLLSRFNHKFSSRNNGSFERQWKRDGSNG